MNTIVFLHVFYTYLGMCVCVYVGTVANRIASTFQGSTQRAAHSNEARNRTLRWLLRLYIAVVTSLWGYLLQQAFLFFFSRGEV